MCSTLTAISDTLMIVEACADINYSTLSAKCDTLINKTLSTETVYQQDVINRDRLSKWLMVGKLGQGMRRCKCNSTSNALVCETQGKVSMYGHVSVSE